MKEFVQLDSQNFYVGQTVNYDWQGVIDVEAPILCEGQKAKYDHANCTWIIKNEVEFDLKEGEIIKNSQVVKIESPGEFYSWNFDTLIWEYDESKKQAKINEINQTAYAEITAVYPEWRQLNITRMKDYNEITLVEYNAMIAFIDEIRAYADYKIMMLG